MDVELCEITDQNREAVLALRVAAGQEQFVASVPKSLRDAAEYPQANPWYRAVYSAGDPVGFVMLSWNVTPQPPEIIGPWFLWRLLIDERHQGHGYGAEVVRQVADLVLANGGTELLTSYVPGAGGPAGFYARLGFVPTGEHDPDGEVIVRLPLPRSQPADAARAALDALTRRFFAAVTFEPGQRPGYDTIRELFIDDGKLIRNSGEHPEIATVDQFIEPRQRSVDSGELSAFSESETAEITEVFGNVAHRFSTYTKSGVLDGRPFTGRGMISTQFVRTPDGWRISSMAWDDERPGLSIPDRYR